MTHTYTDVRKQIGKSLQSMRKAAGYRSAKAFAERLGMNVASYTDYEQGRTGLSIERAWEIADILECSLDELGGRNFTPPGMQPTFADPYQAELNACYEASTPDGKSVILGTARGQRELSKKVPERAVPAPEVTVAKAV